MRTIFILTTLLLIAPTILLAQSCNSIGFTVIYINGVLTEEKTADQNKAALEKLFRQLTGRNDVAFQLGHNPSHFAGASDFLQSIAQTFNTSISDFDRNAILMQIHPQVSTRKILLVGHSQGTFYTNEIHHYLLEHGTPESSVAVYNLATPAYYVAGI